MSSKQRMLLGGSSDCNCPLSALWLATGAYAETTQTATVLATESCGSQDNLTKALAATASGGCLATWVTDIRGEAYDVFSWKPRTTQKVLIPGAEEGISYYFDTYDYLECP